LRRAPLLPGIPHRLLQERLLDFIVEDVGMGDITTEAVIPFNIKVEAQIVAKGALVPAGIHEVKTLFELVGAEVIDSVEEGVEVPAGTILAEIRGDSHAILMVERTLLNILMRMSGIATATRRLVKKVEEAGFEARIAATRKTAPGLLYFDKRAVVVGGGDPHRFRLDDAILIKDNHIALVGDVEEAIRRARSAASFTKKIEIEVQTSEDAVKAAQAGADIIMLDNMTAEGVEETIEALKQRKLRSRVLIEVSGGIVEENILSYAKAGPDIISTGAITHSVRAANISLEMRKIPSAKV
jgi:nicotinate-nucleotide pyrophosphorylase (carboxylating)